MLTQLKDFLFDNIPAEFPSALSRIESVERLRKDVKPIFSFNPCASEIIGRVTSRGVILQRFRSVIGSSGIVFIGQFSEVDNHIVLSGRFTTHPMVRIVAIVFCAIIAILLLLAIGWPVLTNPARSFPVTDVVIGVCLYLFSLLLLISYFFLTLKVSRWLSRGDIPYLSQFITNALGPDQR